MKMREMVESLEAVSEDIVGPGSWEGRANKAAKKMYRGRSGVDTRGIFGKVVKDAGLMKASHEVEKLTDKLLDISDGAREAVNKAKEVLKDMPDDAPGMDYTRKRLQDSVSWAEDELKRFGKAIGEIDKFDDFLQTLDDSLKGVQQSLRKQKPVGPLNKFDRGRMNRKIERRWGRS